MHDALLGSDAKAGAGASAKDAGDGKAPQDMQAHTQAHTQAQSKHTYADADAKYDPREEAGAKMAGRAGSKSDLPPSPRMHDRDDRDRDRDRDRESSSVVSESDILMADVLPPFLRPTLFTYLNFSLEAREQAGNMNLTTSKSLPGDDPYGETYLADSKDAGSYLRHINHLYEKIS
jgi:hypothetical protein